MPPSDRHFWSKSVAALAIGFALPAKAAPIDWQAIQVNTIQSSGGYGITFANLPDGRFVLGQQGKLFVQDAWGAAAKTEAAANGRTFDPSFVAVRNATSALLGAGGSFGAISGLHPFDPSSPATGVQTALPKTAQTYAAAWWHSPVSSLEGWLIGGANGPSGPFSGHNIVFVSADGTKSGAVTEELCTYSAGLATDANGNLYTALYELDGSPNEADADKVLRFSATLLEPKIQAIMDGTTPTPLARSAATFLYKFHSASSVAVDSEGRVWAAGFRVTPMQVFDPTTGAVRSLVPTHPVINGWGPDTYQLNVFTQGGTPRIALLAYDSWMSPDSPVYFVHAPIADVTMPGDTTFSTWRAANFTADALTLATENTLWGEKADPDQDGLPDLMEYAFNTPPLTIDANPVTRSMSSGLLTLSFPRNPLSTDLTYTVEVSTTLATNDWTAIASSTGGLATIASGASSVNETAEGSMVRVTVTDVASAAGEPRRFMRLRVTLTPP